MLIVSVPDRLVRDPATRRVVDDAGLTIDPTDVHWARLLADGDVQKATAEQAAAIKASANPAPVADEPAAEETEA